MKMFAPYLSYIMKAKSGCELITFVNGGARSVDQILNKNFSADQNLVIRTIAFLLKTSVFRVAGI